MTESNAGTLLPCPFCGSSGETLIRGFRYHDGSSEKEAAIWCPTCDCKGPEKAWNTRALSTPALQVEREAIARMRQALIDLIEVERRDSLGNPDLLATDEWRSRAWSNARAAVRVNWHDLASFMKTHFLENTSYEADAKALLERYRVRGRDIGRADEGN